MFNRIILVAVAALFVPITNVAVFAADKEQYPYYCERYPAACAADNTLREGVVVPTTANAQTVVASVPRGITEFCEEYPWEPMCTDASAVRDVDFTSDDLRSMLTSSKKEEITFSPVEPVLLHKDPDGSEWWDRCAMQRKNLLTGYWSLPTDKFAIAAVYDTTNDSRRSVLIVRTSDFEDTVIDCEKERLVSFREFILEGNVIAAMENPRVHNLWGINIKDSPYLP